MAYDEGLAQRVRDMWSERHDVEERKMFGGLCFMVRGHMTVGIVNDELMLRTGPDGYEDALEQPHAREMDFTGRSMRGMIYVGVDGFAEDQDLSGWLERSLAFNRTQDPKQNKPAAKKKATTKKAAKKKKATTKKAAKKR